MSFIIFSYFPPTSITKQNLEFFDAYFLNPVTNIPRRTTSEFMSLPLKLNNVSGMET